MAKTVIVTGGTRGIGAGVAQALYESGWQVIAASASQPEIDGYSGSKQIARRFVDVTDDVSVQDLFAGLDRLDGLVNCAGILRRGAEYDIEVFKRVIDVNLTGTMRCCLAAHPLLAESGGAVVNTTSMLSTFGGPLVPGYSASKGGVAQLTKALAAHWAAEGIRVNAVSPGWIETEMTQALREAPGRSSSILDRTPMKRWGKPSEVGALLRAGRSVEGLAREYEACAETSHERSRQAAAADSDDPSSLTNESRRGPLRAQAS